MTSDKTVTATFTQNEYVLTVNKVGNGTITPDKAAPYHLNDVVVLTAVDDPDWTFSGWSGACAGTGTCSITMTSDMTVTATFMLTTLTNGKYDDADASLNYTGSWSSTSGATGPYLGTLRYTNTGGSYAQVGFTGRQIRLSYRTGPNYGVADVYVDGVKVASVNQYNPTYQWQTVWLSELFAEGDHSVRLVKPSGSGSYYISLDAIEVITTPIILSNGVYDNAEPAFT